jgi:hypothetical protein
MALEYPPPPCPVDDSPFTSCCTQHYSVDETGRIHPGRGGIIVIVQLPARDAALAAASSSVASAVTVPLTPVVAPSLPTTPRRTRRPR